ncbi:MAG: pentapeptide repeat-containing protein [Chlorobiaceae bacterium]|jgi:fluoroquinolone resistance protein|nr:pentapeptide repeat-containing protein [Chlorobiaceae bacterium]
MNTELTEKKVFEKISFRENPLIKGVYEECRFMHCDLNNADLSGITFRNCSFDGCDLSMANVQNSVLQDLKFANCKLLGLQFSQCRSFLLQLDFENCMLKLTLFYKLKLKNTRFKNCNMQEADFTEADLSGAKFEQCDLLQAMFIHTNLEKADFRSAFNYSIDPETNRIRKARFSVPAVTGLLDKYDIEIE